MKTNTNQTPALFFKVALLIVVFLTPLLSCIEKRELKESKYPSGQLEEQYYVKLDKQGNYVRDGKYNRWYASGQKEATGAYKNRPATDTAVGSTGIPKGGREGKWVLWYENGQKKQECTYKNGKSEGTFTLWFDNGQKQEEETYIDGKLEGLATIWYKGGQKQTVASCKNGTEVAETAWYENGQKEHEKAFNPLSMNTWYENGEKESELRGSDTSNFQVVEWYKNGKKEFEGTYKNGKVEGVSTLWYENGQRHSEAVYKDGKQDGPDTEWFDNGQKQAEGVYEAGKQGGKWTRWFDNGQKESEAVWKDGKQNGPVTTWYENGKKKFEGTYEDKKGTADIAAGVNRNNSEESHQSSGNVIASFSGTGTRSTRPFTVNGPWEIQWNAYPAAFGVVAFSMELYDADGNFVDGIANQAEVGPGSSYQPKAGTYYLKISAMGRWAVRIVSTN